MALTKATAEALRDTQLDVVFAEGKLQRCHKDFRPGDAEPLTDAEILAAGTGYVQALEAHDAAVAAAKAELGQ